jgi:hypothetical protein
MKLKLLIGLFIFFAIVGCGQLRNYKYSISDQAKYDINRPVNCEMAQSDIKILESEKASTDQQLQDGIKMVVPAAAARGILHGDYMDRAEVATGEYNAAIDAKINKIKNTCGIQ